MGQESQDQSSLKVTLSKDRARPIFRRAHLLKKVHFIIIPKGSEGYFVFRGTPLSMSKSHCCIKEDPTLESGELSSLGGKG